jgi:tripeptide aminopeptidase
MIQEKRLIDLFKQLCLIDAPPLKEQNSVQFVRKHLERLGLDVFEDNASKSIGGEANNLIATLKGNTPNAPRIFFSAHFDTVEPTKGLIIEERDGVFYSKSDTILGADDKAGMAPIIEAIESLIESGEPHGDVILLLTVAEEIGLLGAFALNIEDLNLDFGYVLDTGPPVGSFVNQAAKHDELRVKIIGRPAHSGKEPEKGINAIQAFSESVSNMRLGRIDEQTTANIGIVRGGTAANIVCPEVNAVAEARSLDNDSLSRQIDHMKDEFQKGAKKYDAVCEINHITHYQGYFVPEQSPVVQLALEAAKLLDLSNKLRTNLGGSDANAFNEKGVPTLVMATGMEHIHTHGECVSIEDLCLTARLCLEIIRKAAHPNPGQQIDSF